MSNLIGVPWFAVEGVWAQVEPFVAQCLSKAKEHRILAQDVYDMLLGRDLQLWIVEEDREICTIVITQILVYPRAKECHIFMASGSYPEDWQDITDDLVRWGKQAGCTHVTAMARRGLIKRMGWQERQTYIVRGVE